MQLPETPQPVFVNSRDKTIVVSVNEWGHPTGVQLEPEARQLSGSELARRIMALYQFAKTIALAVRNTEHHRITGDWLGSWPTPTHVEAAQAQLTV